MFCPTIHTTSPAVARQTKSSKQSMTEEMSELSSQITEVVLRASIDPGHAGLFSEYRIDSDTDVYRVTLSISRPLDGFDSSPLPPPTPPSTLPPSERPRPLPASVEAHWRPSHLTEILVKERREVDEFLGRLATKFDVYQLGDLKSPYPFLHPTFYSFSFRDSAGRSHGFEYQIECSNHLDEKYEGLVREFDSFFESARVFGKFFESRRSKP